MSCPPADGRHGGRGVALARWLLILRDASPQRLHEIDEPARRRKGSLLLADGARHFRLEVSQQRFFVSVPERHRVEGRDLAVDDSCSRHSHPPSAIYNSAVSSPGDNLLAQTMPTDSPRHLFRDLASHPSIAAHYQRSIEK